MEAEVTKNLLLPCIPVLLSALQYLRLVTQ